MRYCDLTAELFSTSLNMKCGKCLLFVCAHLSDQQAEYMRISLYMQKNRVYAYGIALENSLW